MHSDILNRFMLVLDVIRFMLEVCYYSETDCLLIYEIFLRGVKSARLFFQQVLRDY